jgi:small-conductance mechanosensitive channel
MSPRSDRYRRFAIQARQTASQEADNPRLKAAFGEVAEHWEGLAEQSDWLDQKLASSLTQQQQFQSPPMAAEQPPTMHQQQIEPFGMEKE